MATLEQILSFIDDKSVEKTAEESKPAERVQTTKLSAEANALQEALQSVLKTASATEASPVNDLTKIAEEISSINRDSEVKHAQLVGAAMADAFVGRINQWEKAAAESTPKTASVDETSQLRKFAQENPDAYNLAVNRGYADAKALIEKTSADLFEKSYNEEVAVIHKTASEHFVHGWNAMAELDSK